ncbi:hypothetical protein ACED30_14065 [Vibrio splendidus]|uniref:Uncharacterized protein n=2 Tax=Vibrio TaxID=662 RepID=A0A0H3ZPE9_9VIBR|nr:MULTISPECIES: hypothetical protein [Vibrio]AKN37287.1 hypothetical protein [Vibrio sp. F12 FF_152]AKN38060.1 hypothetical protein [Vibrio tasmaniensis]CAH7353078.1 conserved hypothetical protein [Vibrio chagasii]OCH55043.1 hypothetical protein A6E08_20820 [Vibrio lentus]PMI60762.1 hypothetical protein BCU43_08525 [Vibrio lentus]
MKLNVDFSALHLAASKTQGLIAYAETLRELKTPYNEGLIALRDYVITNDGQEHTTQHDGVKVTRFVLACEELHCFQPYQDIDLLYFEY